MHDLELRPRRLAGAEQLIDPCKTLLGFLRQLAARHEDAMQDLVDLLPFGLVIAEQRRQRVDGAIRIQVDEQELLLEDALEPGNAHAPLRRARGADLLEHGEPALVDHTLRQRDIHQRPQQRLYRAARPYPVLERILLVRLGPLACEVPLDAVWRLLHP